MDSVVAGVVRTESYATGGCTDNDCRPGCPAESSFRAEDGLVDIRTPLLGTFYRSPKPGSPPFVELGSHVTRDTVVAIVETMKLMNSVYAGACGTIVEICLGDADLLADHDAVLMRVKPEGV